MKTLEQWRTRAENLEAVIADQQQRLKTAETQLFALQTTSAEMQQRLEWALNEHTRLLEAAQAILGADGSGNICQEFIAHLNSIINADSLALYLIDCEKQIIIHSMFHRRPEAASWKLEEKQLGFAELMTGLSGQVLQTGRPLLSINPDDGLEPPDTLEKRRQIDSGSLIIIPLVTPTGIIGTVTAHNRRTERIFGPHDVTLLMTLAHQAAAAIQRAQLTEEIKQLATTDMLTGLLCRRECLLRAQRELNHCQRLELPASVLMFDVDYFKRVNDTYGHLVGDAVLKAIGEQLLTSLRPYDTIGRFGGEEFFGFFPGTTGPLALQIVERICKKISKLLFSADSASFSITLSVGISVSTDTHDTLELLIDRADKALYSAKQGGRNRAMVWDKPLASE